jgi:hypothetical protein
MTDQPWGVYASYSAAGSVAIPSIAEGGDIGVDLIAG